LILAAMSEFGAQATAALPRSGIPAVEVVFAGAELLLMAVTVVIAMIYDPDRPYRMNYLLLAGGIVTMAVSDRVVTYLLFVGAEGAQLWGGIGFILGPLMIAYAMLENTSQRVDPDGPRGIDWAQLMLPYVGLVGIAVLFAYHTIIGRPLGAFEVCATVVMVLLVTVRQVMAMRAQRLLTQRLYRAQRGLAYQVHHDPLTGLPNRILFTRCLDEAIRGGHFVLIFVDLDDFKEVNDRFGHAAGDELLCAVGDLLKRCVAVSDTLARIGGDEFAILIDGEEDRLESVADRIRVALRDPFPVQGSSVRVRASMGLVAPGAGDEPQTSDDLLRQADVSMYAGKRLGKDTAVIYQPLTGVTADFPTALREAGGGVPAGFSLAFQPVVQLPEGTLVAVEALARWIAPNGLQVSPPTFVVAAEAAGLGAALDAMVLDLACAQVAANGLSVDIHVNVGAARLGNSSFEEHVRRTMSRHRVAPGRLVLEITETVPIVDLAAAAAQICRFNALGVKVALDDFGAGYNSLTYLHALPVHIVKLDRSLVDGGDPARDVALYRSVVGVCDELGFAVIAEGIETTTQAETVQAAGCRLAQGYLFGRAAPIGDVAEHHPAFVNGLN
jgi:diguanylate cyclase (GGDEF)-like protein